ncbi:class I SAM-dependent methyltransferase [Candidatus Frankia alpina]|uniref:class I SAM-dependent methyltransferase n=1 Tax=Candidatus Frankia alpina TaxID=2699483 RepID=UPI001A99D820|nr:class I SAM-dependent methyltransferase [Candidatus Frankia alpina]
MHSDANPTDTNPTDASPAGPFDDGLQFDDTGKVTLDHIYTQPDPHAYFSTLRTLGYHIPQLAKPFFSRLIDECRVQRRLPPTVLDIGCSYGINAALLRCDLTMDDLFERYGAQPSPERDVLLDRDRELVRAHRRSSGTRFIGLDASEPAVSYALAAGFLDEAVCADLEQRDPTEAERARLDGTDLVISTGCIGYVSERTLARVARATDERRPWMAHFVLRMFPFAPFAETLDELGYETVHVDGVFPQRRFASAQEQEQVLDTLASVGVDPRGLETEGWLYAQLHVSRPRGAAGRGANRPIFGQQPAGTLTGRRT